MKVGLGHGGTLQSAGSPRKQGGFIRMDVSVRSLLGFHHFLLQVRSENAPFHLNAIGSRISITRATWRRLVQVITASPIPQQHRAAHWMDARFPFDFSTPP